ncbi:hypothetical protein [Pseudoflavitalea rhizosphaerae]|uniref:hypothetical protein n=1 Tax=Pseudoflavitalea rhizosphaerae TaxID=1884793 RepID=UPI000F8D035E|nr:hypothetical protein [Pseudoflavitalea rhizosphaerae]
MKKLIPFFCCIPLLAGCYFKATKSPGNSRLPAGLYRGGNGWDLIFLKISNDSAYADFIHLEKFPRELHSDTLVYNTVTQSWKSVKSELLQQGKYYSIKSSYTCVTCTMPVGVKIEHKIIADKKLTQVKIDSYKNYAYVNMQHSIYVRKDTINKRKAHYYQLKEKHLFFDSLDIMPYEKLRAAYEKFRAEIE